MAVILKLTGYMSVMLYYGKCKAGLLHEIISTREPVTLSPGVSLEPGEKQKWMEWNRIEIMFARGRCCRL